MTQELHSYWYCSLKKKKNPEKLQFTLFSSKLLNFQTQKETNNLQ